MSSHPMISARDFSPEIVKPVSTARRVEPMKMHLADDDEKERRTPEPIEQPILAPDVTGNLIRTGKGNDMPKGHYDRTKSNRAKKDDKPAEPAKGTTPAATTPSPRKARRGGRNAAPAPSVVRRFGVFDDGSVEVELPGCKGSMSGEEASELVAFIQRLRA